ncbi:MAG: SH3 domain-containing protein [bacterium]|nr:SH3 domain-containing protein [bacterium]
MKRLWLTLFILCFYLASMPLAALAQRGGDDDRDDDGLPNAVDQCPDEAGPRENGGCPLPDPAEPTALPVNPGGDTSSDEGALPVLPVDGPCLLATLAQSGVNIRSAPTLNAEIVGGLNPANIYPALLKLEGPDYSWYLTDLAWVAGWVVRTGGNCDRLPAIQLGQGTLALGELSLTFGMTDGPPPDVSIDENGTPQVSCDPDQQAVFDCEGAVHVVDDVVLLGDAFTSVDPGSDDDPGLPPAVQEVLAMFAVEPGSKPIKPITPADAGAPDEGGISVVQGEDGSYTWIIGGTAPGNDVGYSWVVCTHAGEDVGYSWIVGVDTTPGDEVGWSWIIGSHALPATDEGANVFLLLSSLPGDDIGYSWTIGPDAAPGDDVGYSWRVGADTQPGEEVGWSWIIGGMVQDDGGRQRFTVNFCPGGAAGGAGLGCSSVEIGP